MIHVIALAFWMLAAAAPATSRSQNAPAKPKSSPAPVSELKDYAYPNDGFAISAPSEPVLSKQGTAAEIRKYKVDLRRNIGFVITVYEPKAADAMSEKDALAAARDTSARDFSAKILAEKEISQDGKAGIQYEAASEVLLVRGRVFVVGPRVYAITVVAPVNLPFPPVAGHMLDSFKFLKASAGR